jgi:hypothetical protein
MHICPVRSALVRSGQHIIHASSIIPTPHQDNFRCTSSRRFVPHISSVQRILPTIPSSKRHKCLLHPNPPHFPYAKTPLHPSPQFKLTCLYASSLIRQEFHKDALSLTSCSFTHPAISMHRNSPAHFCANQRTVYARSNSVPQRLHSLTSLYVTRHTRWRYTHDTQVGLGFGANRAHTRLHRRREDRDGIYHLVYKQTPTNARTGIPSSLAHVLVSWTLRLYSLKRQRTPPHVSTPPFTIQILH